MDCQGSVAYLDLKDLKGGGVTLDFLDQRAVWVNKERGAHKVFLDHQGLLEKLVAPEILDRLDLLEKLELLEPWVPVDLLDPRECKVFLVLQVYLVCLESRAIEGLLVTKGPKEILDLLVDQESLDHLVSQV